MVLVMSWKLESKTSKSRNSYCSTFSPCTVLTFLKYGSGVITAWVAETNSPAIRFMVAPVSCNAFTWKRVFPFHFFCGKLPWGGEIWNDSWVTHTGSINWSLRVFVCDIWWTCASCSVLHSKMELVSRVVIWLSCVL